MICLYPELGIEDSEYGVRADAVRELIWSQAADALRVGVDVVLDWNFWSASRRNWAVQHARDLGADLELHRLTTDLEVSTDRARRRAVEGTGYFHEIGTAGNSHLAALMESPAESEGLAIRQV
jgi:predicted kinase